MYDDQHDQQTQYAQQPPQPAGGWKWFSPAAPAASQANGIATASMILGILSVVFCWWGIATLAMGVLAVIFGGVALRRAFEGAPNKGFAIAGLSTGLVGLVLYLIIGISTAGVFLLI